MTATHETILEQLVLDGGDPLTLPPGDTPWCVSRGKIEVYLLSAARRRLVIVVGAGEHVFPLPAGSDLSLVLLAPEGAAIAPSAAADAIAASAQLWLGRADDDARDETPVRAVQNYLLALDAEHARADAERDATDLARLARQDPGAGATAAPDGGLRDALATIAATFRLPAARAASPVSPAADFSAVPQLARAMGFRARQVTLPWAWPRDNLGPLIIVRKADGTIGDADNKIVALLWRSGRYVGPDGPVDEEGAARYEGWAYVAHAPLSPRVVDLFSLGREVLGGAAEEMPWILACGLGVALVGLIVPLATGWLFEDIVPSGQGGLLMAVGIALVAAAVVQLVLGAARGLAQARIEGPSSVQLAAGLTDRLLKLPTRFFKTMSAGDLNQRIQAVETMRALVVGVVLSSGVTAVFSIIYLGLLFSYDARLALIALGVALVYVATLLFSRLLQIAPLREAAAIDGRISGLVYETLEGIAKLRTAAAERRALARWRVLYVKEQEVSVRGDRIAGQFETFADVWQIVALAGLFAVAALLRDRGMNAALFIGFLAGYAIFQSSFVTFCEAVLRLLAAQPLAERARVLLTAETEGKVGSADPGRLTGLIEVSGVSFGYTADGPPLLSQLSFTLMPGEHIAIVGGSGSGKSTVLRLLLGFEAARTGSVFYDGQDLAALDPARVRQQIGVVLQSSRLFAGTILENIRGSGDLSLEQCLRAAELAGLARDLELLPMGLHTAITEGAGTLSGGQRQRILIARAIASEPRILFLDEATSALDNVTQAVVAKTIDSMKVSRVTIAHRLSTVRNADKICVLVDGRFVETGNYRDLIARGGAFAELAQRQLLED